MEFGYNFGWFKYSITDNDWIIDKYKHRVNFRIEKRKGKTDSD